jgi:hypothetical protein
MSATPKFPDSILSEAKQITNGDGTSTLDWWTVQGTGVIITQMGVSTDETADREVIIILNDGTNDRLQWAVSVPLGSGGTAAVPPVDALARGACPFLDEDGWLPVKNGWKVRVKMGSTLTAAKVMNLVALGGQHS